MVSIIILLPPLIAAIIEPRGRETIRTTQLSRAKTRKSLVLSTEQWLWEGQWWWGGGGVGGGRRVYES